jgi:hypothetical protein
MRRGLAFVPLSHRYPLFFSRRSRFGRQQRLIRSRAFLNARLNQRKLRQSPLPETTQSFILGDALLPRGDKAQRLESFWTKSVDSLP